MDKHLNLLDEPWLPVRLRNGQSRELGLLDVFSCTDKIAALADPSPPSQIAQYRLLLAIFHRALMQAHGSWKDKDRLRWHREGLPVEGIHAYLEGLRERFWLFHPEHPFMQVAALATAEATRDKVKPWTQISLASASGNTPVVFDHAWDETPGPISEAAAFCALLGFLQFTPGGLVKVFRSSDKAGPLANTAAVLPMGANLSQTLCLALHRSSPSGIDDLPSWEQTPPDTVALSGEPTPASGPNDRYTRLSRAVLLLRDDSGGVRGIRFGAGRALADNEHTVDPMASYRVGANGPVRITFREGRAFWRDLPVLLPDPEGAAALPAPVLGQATNLLHIADETQQALLVSGIASDQAKLLRWRSETLHLPAALLESEALAQQLRNLVQEAEEVFRALRSICSDMLADTLPDSRSKDTKARSRELFDAGSAASTYFVAAEKLLTPTCQALAQADLDRAQHVWRDGLRRAAEAAWQVVRRSAGMTPRALRADALTYPKYRRLIARIRKQSASQTATQEENI